ncbi:MAG: enoyl-CoA hydratase-related protein [Thermoplasmatota archaeon]
MVLDVQRDGDVTTLTVNRPEALNALNSEVLTAIHEAVEATQGGSIILTGAGKAFVAGADIAEMKDYGPEEAEAFSRRGQAAFQALQDFPGPTIAAVNGFALGGGLELALACDLLLCSEKAKLGLPETTLAVVPGFGGTQRLARRVGPGMAKRLMFTGDMIDAATAGLMGLCDGVVAPDDLLDEARAIATKAGRNGPLAIAACKRLVNEGLDLPVKDAISLEAEAFGQIFGTQDQKEGMGAFLDKRKPEFKGA